MSIRSTTWWTYSQRAFTYVNTLTDAKYPSFYLSNLLTPRLSQRYNWSDAQPHSHTLIATYMITRAHMAAASLCAPDTMCGWGAWDARTTAAAHAPTRVPSLSLTRARTRTPNNPLIFAPMTCRVLPPRRPHRWDQT